MGSTSDHRGTSARAGYGVGDQVRFPPPPVGKRAAAGAADLIRQQLDDAVVLTVIVRFDDPVFVPVAKSNQPGLFDRRSQQLIEVSDPVLACEGPFETIVHVSCWTYFCQL